MPRDFRLGRERRAWPGYSSFKFHRKIDEGRVTTAILLDPHVPRSSLVGCESAAAGEPLGETGPTKVVAPARRRSLEPGIPASPSQWPPIAKPALAPRATSDDDSGHGSKSPTSIELSQSRPLVPHHSPADSPKESPTDSPKDSPQDSPSIPNRTLGRGAIVGAASAPSRFDGLGLHYTSWGTRHSLGSLVTEGLRHAMLCKLARAAADRLQGGHDSGWRYWVASGIKGLSNITGSIAQVTGGTVSAIESVVSNVGGGLLRVAGAAGLGLAGGALKLAGAANPNADAAGNAMLGKAGRLLTGWSYWNKGKQSEATPEQAEGALTAAELADSAYGGPVSDALSAKGFKPIPFAQVPRQVLARRENVDGHDVRLTYVESTGLLYGDAWSGLKVRALRRFESGKSVYYLSFAGVGDWSRRLANIKSCIAQGVGIEDSALQEADALVRAFVGLYGASNVKIVGHSFGGALAQWAGIGNGVEVVCFNSAALHVNLRNRLGRQRIDRANVRHFNTRGDKLTQIAEGRRVPWSASAQVGVRASVDGDGHDMKDMIAALRETIAAPAVSIHA